MKPKITLVANYVPDKQESMSRLADLFRAVLTEAGFETETIRPIDRVGKLRRFFPRLEKWLGYVDKYLIFPCELFIHSLRTRRDKNFVYHITDHSNAVYSFVLGRRPHVATCNDVLAIRSALGEIPENPTGFTGRLLQKAILAGLRHTPRVVCISSNTEHELRRLLRKECSKVTTALLPLNGDFSPIDKKQAAAILERLGGEVQHAAETGFILHIGGNQWYKNRIGACRIYAELMNLRARAGKSTGPLILAGKKPSEELMSFARHNASLGIIFIESPTDEEVRALYSLAAVFLFPSLQEGFGWPIVEAMACGCPVATTERAPMTEGGGDAAVYFDPNDLLASAQQLDEMLSWDDAERADRISRGFANVKRFSRTLLADHYASAYDEALKSGKSARP